MTGSGKPRVVVLGGGFAGVYTAMRLERSLGRRQDFEIALVSKDNCFVFQPMLPELISGTIGLLDVVRPLRRLLRQTDVHVREIEAIDLDRREVRLQPGFLPHAHTLRYDQLVLALGTVTDFRGLRGLPEHAFPFKDLGDRVYMIRSGRAEVRRDDGHGERAVALLGAGECFGEMALLAGTTRSASVRCVEPMDVVTLPRRDFAALAEHVPELRKGFERVARSRTTGAAAPRAAREAEIA